METWKALIGIVGVGTAITGSFLENMPLLIMGLIIFFITFIGDVEKNKLEVEKINTKLDFYEKIKNLEEKYEKTESEQKNINRQLKKLQKTNVGTKK